MCLIFFYLIFWVYFEFDSCWRQHCFTHFKVVPISRHLLNIFFKKIKILMKLKSKASQENILAKFQENNFCFCFCFSHNCTLRFANFKKTMKLLDPHPPPTIHPALRFRAASCIFFELT